MLSLEKRLFSSVWTKRMIFKCKFNGWMNNDHECIKVGFIVWTYCKMNSYIRIMSAE